MLAVMNMLSLDVMPADEVPTTIAAWEAMAQGTLIDSSACFPHR
jgi:hypothetical protein